MKDPTKDPIKVKIPDPLDEQVKMGCAGLFVGGIVFSLLGLGLGLVFLSIPQAFGISIISGMVGSVGTAIFSFKNL